MAAEAHNLTTENPSSTANHHHHDAGDFECNICFDLAQDPVITLCGHLHCWPCLYRWLRCHSRSHECPVCKALIDEHKLIPLYGRGKTPSDPRSKPLHGVQIPNRPAGQRPETAPPPPPPPPQANNNNLADAVFRQIGPAGVGNFGMFAGFPILNVQFHGFSGGGGYGGGSSTYGYGYSSGSFREGGLNRESGETEQAASDVNLKRILVFALCFLLFALLTM